MAGTVVVRLSLETDGLGSGSQKLNCRYSEETPPEEVFYGYQILGTSAANLDLGAIAVTKIRGIMIKAIIGTVGVLVNDVGTGTPSATAGNIVIPINGCTYIPIAGGLTPAYTIRVIGSSATTAIEYLIYGQET